LERCDAPIPNSPLSRARLSGASGELNALEYMWRAGHASLDRVQAIVRNLKLSEPADRIPRFLLR
jgi:hypothetical protein